MTSGMMFRVEREGKFINLPLEDLTENEMYNALSKREKEWLVSVINRFCEVYGRREDEA